MKVGYSLLLAAAIGSAVFCQRASADFIAYDNSNVAPNQNWNGNLGLDFDVNKPISVTELGAFYGDNVTNISKGVVVAIFDRSTQTQVGSSVTITDSNYTSTIGGDAFYSLTSPISLGVGSYSIVSFVDPNYNEGYYSTVSNPTSTEDSGGGAISFVGSGRYDSNSTALDYPTQIDGGPENRYDAGTFKFVAVPLPSAIWGGFGLIAGLFAIRKLRPIAA